ncbi:hypothetical protein ACH5RR_009533 [Cinchona calisaya]|uniref:Uncharacterized protein n=1 Tax=Cinchona calisaya TaxID=153742 RepID=A0ABD3AEJ4_9GENT
MTLALMYVMAVISLVATPDQVRGMATKVFIYSGAAIVHNVLTEKHFFNVICASFPFGFAAFLLSYASPTSASSSMHKQAIAHAKLAASTSLNNGSNINEVLNELTDESGLTILPVSDSCQIEKMQDSFQIWLLQVYIFL